MRQELHFMIWEPRPQTFGGGIFKPINLERTPDRVWTLYHELDESKPPKLPIIPVHNYGAFLEDYVHDWNLERNGRFRFYTRIMDRSVWILLEYKE